MGDLYQYLSEKAAIPGLAARAGTPHGCRRPSHFFMLNQKADHVYKTAQIRTSYVDQLRRANVISHSFYPGVFGTLDVTERSRGRDLSGWDLEDFDIDGGLVSEIIPML